MTEVSERNPELLAEPGVYAEIVRFYAHQMRLLDNGDAEGWARTFAGDGVFRSPVRQDPVTGRDQIRDGARTTAADLASRQITRRHWVGMIEARQRQDGSVHASSYAQVIETQRGAQPALTMSVTCDDILVREDGQWVVQDRTIIRDDLS